MGIGALFVFVRCLERIFSPRTFRRLLVPCIKARIAFKKSRLPLPLPGCLGTGELRNSEEERRNDFLNAILEFFPEQLGTPKWRERAHIDGIQHLETARRQKRPVILAFCHFGPYSLLRYWLRAAGFPAAFLVKGQSEIRSPMKRLKDSVSPFPEVPAVFYQEDQLRDAIEFLDAGNPLLIAIDAAIGKHMDIPVDDDWQFGMSNGAIRIAMRRGAELIPCSIVDEGDWRFQIRLGSPVPASLLAAGDPLPVGKYLLDAMIPTWREYPEQCPGKLLKKFRRADSQNNSSDEIVDPGQHIAG
jgi:lauroyl/myristoyl acyltransferase